MLLMDGKFRKRSLGNRWKNIQAMYHVSVSCLLCSKSKAVNDRLLQDAGLSLRAGLPCSWILIVGFS